MSPGNVISLIVRGIPYTVPPGLSVIGSTEHEPYNSLLVADQTVSPKHASIRYDSATNRLEVMDLCSHSGVTVDQRPLDPLVWCEINALSRILFGSVTVIVKIDLPSKKPDISFFQDDDSIDFIDCSLEESHLLKSRQAATSGSGGSLNESLTPFASIRATATLSSAEEHKSARRSSFLVPATQQLEESMSSTVPNGSKLDIEDGIASRQPIDEANPETGLLGKKDGDDDDDGFFFIPETQLDELDCVSAVIGGIAPVGEPTCCVVTQSAEDDYFQMTEQDDDDQNSIDGLFNNKYIEESQNLLQSMDESYRVQAPEPDDRQQRASIPPVRSVDSISCHENRNTTQEMSRIEWNESKQANDQSIAVVVSEMEPGPRQGEAYCGEPDDRTVTPDLVFDKTQDGEKEPRNGSATPDLELNNQPGATDRGEEDDRTVTPDLVFDKPQGGEKESRAGSATPGLNVHLNGKSGATDRGEEGDRTATPDLNFDEPLEAANKKRDSSATPELELDSKAPQKSTHAVTPALCIEEQQDHDQEPEISLNQEGAVPPATNNVYEIDTQALIADEVELPADDDVDPYDLATQPLPRMKAPVLPAVVRPKSQRKKKDSPAKVDEKDLVTQPLTPPSLALVSRATRRKKAPEVSFPVSIDPSDLLTQPLSPPRRYLSGGVRKDSPAKTKTSPEATSTVYDLQTQPLSPALSRMLSDDRFSDKVPVVALIDIKHFRRTVESVRDPYLAATQPLIEDEEGNVYDLPTQPFCTTSQLTAGSGSDLDDSGNHTIPMAVNEQYLSTRGESSNVTQFCPQINSTARQSMIADQRQEQQLKISPSSNKENQAADTLSTEPEDEDLEDSFCLAATLPVGELGTGGPTDSKPSGKVNKRSTKKTDELTFKLPATKTPAPRKRKASPFSQFSTPEHSLFACLPKADVIRSSTSVMSELYGSSSPGAVSKHPYPFGDGSSSDSEEDSKVFKKTNVSEAFERELEKSKEDAKRSKLAKEAKTDRQTKSGRSKRTEKPVEKKELEAHGAAGEGTSTKTSTTTKTERKSTRKRESTKKLEAKDSKPTRSKRGFESSEPAAEHNAVPKRSRREVRQKIPTIEESVEYDRHSTGVSSGGNEIVPQSRTRTRQESSTERQEKLSTEATERTTSAAIATTRTSRKKVDASNDVTGREENGSSLVGAAGGVERETPVRGNLSSTSSVASDGSNMSVRARNPRPMIMFTRLDPKPYRAIIARAGGKVVDIPEMATILVTDRIKRTYKFLCAVAKGIPIVGQSYLDALRATDRKDKPDPWEHILVDDESEKRYAFRLRDTLLKAHQNQLFRDYTVFVTSNTQPPASDLFLILSCAGAKPLKNPPSSSSPPINVHKMFVISSLADAASWEKYREKYPSIEIISTEGFMISIIHHVVSFEKYRLL